MNSPHIQAVADHTQSRLAALKVEYGEAVGLYEKHAHMLEALKQSRPDELSRELDALVQDANAGWDTWGRIDQWLALEKARIIWLLEVRRYWESEKAAGRDPYDSEPTPPCPKKFGMLAHELPGIEALRPRHPLAISRDIASLPQ